MLAELHRSNQASNQQEGSFNAEILGEMPHQGSAEEELQEEVGQDEGGADDDADDHLTRTQTHPQDVSVVALVT